MISRFDVGVYDSVSVWGGCEWDGAEDFKQDFWWETLCNWRLVSCARDELSSCACNILAESVHHSRRVVVVGDDEGQWGLVARAGRLDDESYL